MEQLMPRLRIAFVIGILVTAGGVAGAGKPKVALVPFEGDRDGQVGAVVSDVLGGDAAVVGFKEVNRTVERLGLDADLTDKDLKKLANELDADAIVQGKLDGKSGARVLHVRLFVHGKRAKGFKIEFATPKSDKFKTALHDTLVKKIGVGEDGDDDAPKAKKKKKVADDDAEDKPKAKDRDKDKKKKVADDDADDKPKAKDKKKKVADDDADPNFDRPNGDKPKAKDKKKKPADDDDGEKPKDKVADKSKAKAKDKDKDKDKAADRDKDDDDKPKAKDKKKKASDDDDDKPKDKVADKSDKADKADKADKDNDDGDKPKAKAKNDGDKDAADDDAPKAKKKRTARADDDEDTGVRAKVDVGGGSGRTRDASRDAARVDVGPSFANRSLSFVSRASPQAPTNYDNSVVPGARVDGELYPLAFSSPKSIAAGLGVAGYFDQTFGLSLQSSSAPGMKFAVTQRHFAVGLRLRLLFGDKPTSPGLTVGADYGARIFSVARMGAAIDLPDTDYTYVAPGAAFRFPFTPTIAFTLGGRALLFQGAGNITTAAEYGRARVTGLDGTAGIEFVVAKFLVVRAAGEFTQIGFAFTGAGEKTLDSNGNALVGGATDRYLGGVVTLGGIY
jgi:hypothetical protein